MSEKIKPESQERELGDEKEEKAPRIKPIIEAADSLSLGISMVVAVIMGVGLGYLLRSLTGLGFTFWIGVFIGVAAAILNVFKAYEKERKSYEKLAKEPRYAIKNKLDQKDDDDDEDYGEKNY
ncbi:MAG: AtpZ/AtpI family protein [Epsilonproteobacteria bacterium]|nr:AtpZ/AtpI family protein [Campylobacterota bacterium]OIO13178.1 MAG: arginine biosynthesis protein ArgJ [Helicobacteraceae bacterium CG1_02_36_14]PIP09389.1 MAG: arginine biosynthesis protein ArgJ [Sulfurimonas sp. CG23_combo_of_CG06-09_8_20_14_all_36_33]PIS26051.1 MAG: arginine biosynthesis protein ArgJ [Sulfurimonas sp. CG08_land_8_20_14_0_20_36_33]PIU35316.1 MAG: arginine biosynthesis protein ArgJ [Sulfurimonas sp. CG07_land_8_20_14_0_80_36_56]PIV02854.1 MAG: arginine biosynthesis protei